jgi:type II secretory pathway pseudopilin PulG
MTLIELLVVLGILAALAGMTLSFVGEMSRSARQDLTRNRLDQIESAIVGDGTHSSRFLNDMGRLPVLPPEPPTSTDEKKDDLSELWDFSLFDLATNNLEMNYCGYDNDIYNDDINAPAGLNHQPFPITLHGGWKGPYLNVRNGKLYDGFGNDLETVYTQLSNETLSDGTRADDSGIDPDLAWMITANPDGTILRFGSLGEDQQKDGTGTPSPSWQNRDDRREIHRSQVFSKLHVSILVRDSVTNPAVWLPPGDAPAAGYEKYDPAVSYAIGNIVRPNETVPPSGHDHDLFVCSGLPEAGGSLPASAEGIVWKRNQTVIDEHGGQWRWLPYSRQLNHLRVAVFSPYVEPEHDGSGRKTAAIRISTAFYPDPNPLVPNTLVWGSDVEFPVEIEDGSAGGVTFSHLTPGIRKILAYGYLENTDGTHCNAWHSNVQTIELKPGENFRTLYLTESFTGTE